MLVTAPERVFLPALGDWVEGDVDVPDDVARSLIDQGWTPAIPADGGPTKAELVAIASDLGLELKKSWTAKRIAEELEARAAQAPEPDESPTPEPATAEQED